MGKAGRKIKAMSPERLAARELKAVNDTAAAAGLPEAQRRAGELAIVATAIDDRPRPLERTVRKLTRVEMLRRSGVLEPHEADACEWYCDVAALAWDTVGCTASYDIAGGGRGAHAPDRLAAKTLEVARARDDYALGRSAIPDVYLGMFEAVVCRNDSIGTVAEQLFAQLQRSQRESKVRVALKLCANLLHGQIAALLPMT